MKQLDVWKRPGYERRFYKIEFRIGRHNADGSGLSQLTQNRLVGVQEEFDLDLIEIFTIQPKVDGRYLTLQTLNGVFAVEVNEIFVYI